MGVLGFHVVTPSEHLYPHFTDEETVTCDCPWAIFGPEGASSSRLEPGVISGYALLPTEKPKKARTKTGSWSPGAQPLRQPAAPLHWTPSQSEPRPHSRVTQPVDSWG